MRTILFFTMNHQQYVRGKWMVLAIGAALLGISVWVTVYYVMVRGTDRIIVQSLRFALEVALLWQLYRGHAWARWVMVVLFGIGGVLGVVGMGSRLSPLAVLMPLAYLSSAILLAISPSIATFLTEQERRRHCGE
jgi:hypothetical protein